MAANEKSDPIREQIFAIPEGLDVYAVLDGASAEQLPQQIGRHAVASACLLPGELDPGLAQVAPYLVALDAQSPFTDWVIGEGWGRHWGIFAVSGAGLRTLRRHFRSLLTVYDPDNLPLFFRYYDPRVLRVYLPTCTSEELDVVFGPVHRYLMEAEDGARLLRCERKEGAMVLR